MKTLIRLALAMAPLAAQTNVSGPEIGFVYDSRDQGLRPIRGIPASAMLGERLPVDLDYAVTAPNGYAIGVDRGTGAAVLISAAGNVNLSGMRRGPALIAISPRGRAAALYFPDAAVIQIVAGLPSASSVIREVELAGTPSAIAVSDDANLVLASVERDDDDVDALILFSATSPSQVLLRNSRIAAVDFAPDSPMALAAGSNAVWLIRDGAISTLLDQRDGVVDPVGVAVSADGKRAIVATRGGQVLLRDLAGGSQSVAVCQCAPSGLSRLRGGNVFRLNEASDGTIWLFDTDGPEPRVMFVAAAAQSGS